MSENPDTPNAPAPTPSPADAAVAVLGVTTQAVAGEVGTTAPVDPVNTDPPPAAPYPTPEPRAHLAAVMIAANLNAIEQLAIYWGGETGVKIRNHVIRVRELLGV